MGSPKSIAVALWVTASAIAAEPGVEPKAHCVNAPKGVVAWWDAEAIHKDSIVDVRGSHPGKADRVSLSSGYVGSAFNFNGSNLITIPYSPALAPGRGMTIEGWVRPEAPPTVWARIAGVQSDNLYTSTWVFGTSTTGGLYFGLFKNGAQTYLDGRTPLAVGVWTHVTAIWEGETMRVAINGVIQPEVATFVGPLNPSTFPLRIGRGDTSSYGFRGLIDELTLYDRPLTAEELAGIAASRLGKCK